MTFPNIPGLPGLPPPEPPDPFGPPSPIGQLPPGPAAAGAPGLLPPLPGMSTLEPDPFGAPQMMPPGAPPMGAFDDPLAGFGLNTPIDPMTGLPMDPTTQLLGRDPMAAGLMAGIAGVDPMLGEQAPMASPTDELEALGDPEADDSLLEPMYRAWLFKKVKLENPDGTFRIERELAPPRKPTVGECQDWIQADQTYYSGLTSRHLQMLQFYRRMHSHIFDATEWELENEVYRSIEATVQLDKLCHMIGYMNLRVDKPFTTADEEVDAQRFENAAMFFYRLWQKRHRQDGGAHLQHELAFSAGLYGMTAVRVTCDPDDWDEPLTFKLFDPSAVFPVWGEKYGLTRVSCVTSTTLSKILDQFDPYGTVKLDRKFVKHYQTQKDDLDFTRDVEVREVWTRWYRYVEVDGMTVLPPTAHQYGLVPWVITPMPGELAGSATPDRQGRFTRREIELGYTGAEGSSVALDVQHRFHSFLGPMEDVIKAEEAVMGMLFTMLEQDTKPAQITTSPYPDNPDPVDTAAGGQTKRRPGEMTEPVQFTARTQALMPLMENLRNQRVRAWLPDNVFGILDGANVSGFTENTLMASAKDRIEPYIDSVCSTVSDVIELAMYLYQGFGHLYIDDPEGIWRVPGVFTDGMGIAGPLAEMAGQMTGADYSKPVNEYPGLIELSPQLIRRMGPEINTKLELIDWRELSTMANVAGILIDKGVWSRWTGMDRMGIDNPRLEEMRIAVEQAKMSPEYIKSVYLPKMLYESGDQEAFIAYLTTTLFPGMMAQAPPMGMPGAMPGAMPPGMGGLGPGMMGPPQNPMNPGSVAGMQSVQGDSQPAFGPPGQPGRPGNGKDASLPVPGGPGGPG